MGYWKYPPKCPKIVLTTTRRHVDYDSIFHQYFAVKRKSLMTKKLESSVSTFYDINLKGVG